MAAATHPTPRKRAAHAKIAPEDLPARLEAVAEHEKPPASLKDLTRALQACRACPLWRDATQAVPGEGADDEPLLALVGEQPGDQEDLAGHPFVGPAGKVLDRALEAAGIESGELFVTNAVKHFKHEMRGKRRLHKKPNVGEIERCRWWYEQERTLVRPAVIVALGATATRSVFGRTMPIGKSRGAPLRLADGTAAFVTIHPSALLRIRERADKEREYQNLVGDLRQVAALLRRQAA
jgi:uracil-DNA glycosylase family protein